MLKAGDKAPRFELTSDAGKKCSLGDFAGKKAVVGLEGDGRFGYALYMGGYYKPGSEEGDLSAHDLPSDLKHYLHSMKTQ